MDDFEFLLGQYRSEYFFLKNSGNIIESERVDKSVNLLDQYLNKFIDIFISNIFNTKYEDYAKDLLFTIVEEWIDDHDIYSLSKIICLYIEDSRYSQINDEIYSILLKVAII